VCGCVLTVIEPEFRSATFPQFPPNYLHTKPRSTRTDNCGELGFPFLFLGFVLACNLQTQTQFLHCNFVIAFRRPDTRKRQLRAPHFDLSDETHTLIVWQINVHFHWRISVWEFRLHETAKCRFYFLIRLHRFLMTDEYILHGTMTQ